MNFKNYFIKIHNFKLNFLKKKKLMKKSFKI